MSVLLTSINSLGQRLHRFPCRVLAFRESVPPGLSGSFVAVSGAGRSLQVGLMSDPMGWQAFNQALQAIVMPTPESLIDGASELAAAAAAAFTQQLPDGAELTLGLPRYVDGDVFISDGTELQAADVVLGSTRALVVLLEQSRA
jgi:hypothetical protein